MSDSATPNDELYSLLGDLCNGTLLPEQLARLRSRKDIEVCDKCGTFIYFERIRETRVPAESKPAAAKSERLKVAMA